MLDEQHLNFLRNRLKIEEGFRLQGYKDIKGNWTGGYGHKFIKPWDWYKHFTEKDWEFTLEKDIKKVIDAFYKQHIIHTLSQARQLVLMDMCFQMGYEGLLKFEKMWKAIYASDFLKAAAEMLDSDWGRTHNSRAKALAKIMKTGEM